MQVPLRTVAIWLVAAAGTACAQGPVGSVSTIDATVVNNGEGVIEASAGRALVRGSGTVTARDHTARVELARGGEVRVCRSTAVHLTSAKNDSLLVGLDRGAMELTMKARLGDVVVTPDLVLAMDQARPLDLAMRVTVNGDTCVENRGTGAPLLKITDAFGEATYELKAGQHVLFEHGSLREVVDAETTPCGCPPDEPKTVALADALLSGGTTTGPTTPAQAAQAHPFPAAVSEGLANPAPAPPAAPGETHVQVATTMTYDPIPSAPPAPAPTPASASPAAPPSAQPVQIPATVPATKAPAPNKPAGGPFRAVGRFFRHIFAR